MRAKEDVVDIVTGMGLLTGTIWSIEAKVNNYIEFATIKKTNELIFNPLGTDSAINLLFNVQNSGEPYQKCRHYFFRIGINKIFRRCLDGDSE